MKGKKEKCFCGPSYFPDKINCMLSKWFNKSCKTHDRLYRLNKGRAKSDIIFLGDMLRESGGNPVKYLVAMIYYLILFFFGWISYYFTGEKGLRKD